MSEQFWVVWNPQRNPPMYKHMTEEAAIAEAERLARLNPDHTFIVLEAIAARTTDTMLRRDLRKGTGDDIPL